MRTATPELTIIGSDQFYRVGEADFGVPGLIAIESVGPFAPTQQVGPFVMIHDGFFDPGFGIGHHPHRYHERLFYILTGRVEHDDALNGITGEMNAGDLARLTEGVRGMYHREWNGAPPGEMSRAFILVYRPDAVPEIPVASFDVLRAADRPRSADGDGETLELIGPTSPFRVNLSTFRRYLDTSLPVGGSLPMELAEDELAYLYPIAGSTSVTDGAGGELATLRADGSTLPEGPAEAAVAGGPGGLRLTAGRDGEARVLRVVVSRA
jgi:redox-sensitive bicupin YhaK (pirin superfamily)